MRYSRGLAILVGTFIVASAPWAYAVTTLFVANNGVDSSACGSQINPCRSITQGIANASPGDKIIVGPGTYGDLDGDGILGETGEETSTGCVGCMLGIHKPVTLTSSDGAAATIIDARTAFYSHNVRITADGVVFGAPGQGFTVTSTAANDLDIAFGNGVVIDSDGVNVQGNQIVHFETEASRSPAGYGIYAFGLAQIEGNQVSGWGTGIAGNPNTTIKQNAVQSNEYGIQTFGSTVTGNIVIGNRNSGISLYDDSSVVGNTILGNTSTGIFIFDSGVTGTIESNNIFGNGCGMNASTGGVLATNNYWGAATGPGADPADDVCGSGGATATTTPFATKAFSVKVSIKP